MAEHQIPSPSSSSSSSSSQPPQSHCQSCGIPITSPPSISPPPPHFSSTSPPPTYIPIRSPAIKTPSTNTAAIVLSPVPRPLPVPLSTPPHHFQIPSKRISSVPDILSFHSSPAGQHFLGFVAALSESVCGRKIHDPVQPLSPPLSSLLSLIETLDRWTDEIPPVPHSSRYGNPAFRCWHDKLSNEGMPLLLSVLMLEEEEDVLPLSAADEIFPYLLDSFGNASRIDYGTGHETNFVALLYCVARIGLIKEEDYPALVTRVFVAYLNLMRKLQALYCLEPAGSHGVWGLDDYHFLPFIFGSAQLIDHKYMKPKSIHNVDILDNFSNEYMYLACVSFVRKVKKGVFGEHSPMLDDISGVPTWTKVNSGLLKMYKAEVLEKVPIMQHFLFGSLIKWE